MDSIESRLKYIRKKAGFSQKVLAEHLGITARTLQRYEKDATTLTIAIATNISLYCKADLIWLLTGKDIDSKQDFVAEDPESQRVIIDHQDIIKGFHDPVLGKELNEELIFVQNTDPDLFKNTVKTVRAAGDMARAKKAMGIQGIPPTEENMRDRRRDKDKQRWGEEESHKDGTNGK